ncbi:GTP cyclohydrolase [Cordyceps militaris]|uniref:GTP cyclohydrolase 1 n=1 Tax=Cordyceps militaris TaxID=73501 RepID=A0A2H4SI72_CORMI|nr:GTP cyclohydrolase [Cordyceps militaris]
MKFAAVLAFAATAVLAAPPKATDATKVTDAAAKDDKNSGRLCLGRDRGRKPGSWVYNYCPEYYFFPNSQCITIPGEPGDDYPRCRLIWLVNKVPAVYLPWLAQLAGGGHHLLKGGRALRSCNADYLMFKPSGDGRTTHYGSRCREPNKAVPVFFFLIPPSTRKPHSLHQPHSLTQRAFFLNCFISFLLPFLPSVSGSSSSSDNSSSRKRKRSSKKNGGGGDTEQAPKKPPFSDQHLLANGHRRNSTSKAARDPRDDARAVAVRQPAPVVDHDGLSRAAKGTRARSQETPEQAAARLEKMRGAVRTLLECVGEDPDREGLLDTPSRYAKAMLFFTKGYQVNVDDLVNNALFNEGHNEMIVVKDITIHSLCEHHLVPFTGKMHIGYIPRNTVIGLSKLPRIAEMYARRLQVQERLTKEVANAVMDILKPQGVAVVMESSHLCMVMRGVEQTATSTITSCVLGCFERKSKTRNEFLSLVGINR